MKHTIVLAACLLIFATACGPSSAEQATMTATVQTATAASWTKTPTATLIPTLTPTLTPSPTHTAIPEFLSGWIFYENEWLTLYYPPDWTTTEPREHACMPGSTDCVINLLHSAAEDVRIEIVRYPPGSSPVQDVEKTDQEDWDLKIMLAMLNGIDINAIKLISRTVFEVGGETAVQRVYEYPIVDMASMRIVGKWYINNVRVINGKDEYIFEMRTEVQEEFNAYQNIPDQILSTIVFLK